MRERRASVLPCPSCAVPLAVTEILGVAHMAPAGWLHFECPKCSKQSHLQFLTNRLAIGDFDGFPGPSFIPSSSIWVEHQVEEFPGGMRVALEGREWTYAVER
jgi:hypothetical protein